MDIDRIKARIEALLRLADGNANQHEAEAAAAAAQALMARYRVETEDPGEQEPALVERLVATGVSTRTIWRGSLALAIARANHCSIWWRGPRLLFFGTREDTEHCEMMYRFLDAQVVRLGAVGSHAKGPRYRTEYIQGLVVGIRDRLHASSRSAIAMASSSVRARFARLDDLVAAEARRLSVTPQVGAQGPKDPAAFDTGRAHGSAVVLERRPALPGSK